MGLIRRTTGLLAATMLVLAGGWLIASPAAAVPVADTQGGITYEADDETAAGATVTAFDGSTTTVTIPDTVTIGGDDYDVVEIAEDAFRGESLTSVTIGGNVSTIGDYAFYLNDLTSLTLPESVTSIGTSVFSINHLTSLSLPDSLTSFGTRAFFGNELESVTIPDTVTEIGQGVFRANDLTSLTLPDSVTDISIYAFLGNKLTSLTLGDSVTSIGFRAFSDNKLTSVTIPDSVTTIRGDAFHENPGLASVTFTGPAPALLGSASDSDPTFDTSSGSLVLSYPWRYGDSQTSGGYTSSTWEGYDAQAIATVDFDLNGYGSTTPDEQGVVVGEQATEPAEPTASGYVFTGWYTDADANDAFDFSTQIDRDRTLYAGWEVELTAPQITGDATADGKIGETFSYTATLGGLPAPTVSLTDGELPEGLSLDEDTGEISGTPTGEPGDYAIELAASNGVEPAATLSVVITIAAEDSGGDPGNGGGPGNGGAPGDTDNGGDTHNGGTNTGDPVNAGSSLPDTGGAPVGLLLIAGLSLAAGVALLRRRFA